MAPKKAKVNWDVIYSVIESIPPGYWMAYGDVCEAAGLTRKTAQALGLALAKRSDVPKNIYRVLRADGCLSAGWKGVIGNSDDAVALLKEEGLAFDKYGTADPRKRLKELSL